MIKCYDPMYNEKLKPVFNILLPHLEENSIDYWVYGGISIAAYHGSFYRENGDVDIFVKEKDFNKSQILLKELCNKQGYLLETCKPLKRTNRPKLNVIINGTERLSVVPIYVQDTVVELKFCKDVETYDLALLNIVERTIDGFKFYTPPDYLIIKLFKNYLKTKKEKVGKVKLDAEKILSKSDFEKEYNTT